MPPSRPSEEKSTGPLPTEPSPACLPRDVITPAPRERSPEDAESATVWGFRDSRFFVNEAGHVALSGQRYPLSGSELPDLLPWMSRTLSVEIDPRDRRPAPEIPPIPPSRAGEELIRALIQALSAERVTVEDRIRQRRGHGHTQEEMYAIKERGLSRVPDVVVEPESPAEVLRLVEVARDLRACLVPYGGGTNVSQALRCPEGEARSIVAVDMARMSRIRWIDPENRMACIEAGAVGRDIQAQLAEHGLTLGHEPDSIEFSTLGGWIATRASGMKKNRYGNIEDLVLDIEAVTADGILTRSTLSARESLGPDPKDFLLGSEGTLGIITSAVVKLFPAPVEQRYASLIFRDFDSGVDFLAALERLGDLPASVRLVDNLQFQFGQALKPRSSGLRQLKRRLERFLVTRVLRYDPDEMTACTLVYEGSAEEVARQEKRVKSLARQFGGMAGGAENGERGYQLTFSIAYIRDFAMEHFILGESFETSVSWSRLRGLCENVKQRIFQEHSKRGLPGRPFVTCRVTQLYETGVCVYFYFAFHFKGVEAPSRLFAEIEHAAREEILRCGGSLSHHHGVGKLREEFLPEVMSSAGLALRRGLKRATDPDNLFASGNLGFGADEPTRQP